MYLNLVLEFVPETVFRISKHYSKSGQRMPTLFVKLYVFQMCRALAHIHAMGVCHRDIKPQNLLVNTHTHQLKLCDFGSAKVEPTQAVTHSDADDITVKVIQLLALNPSLQRLILYWKVQLHA